MRSLASFLERLVRELGYEQRIEDERIISSWAEMVGPKIAGISKAERVERGVLYVKVENSVWRNELSLEKSKIMDVLRERSGSRRIKEIRFI